MAMVNTSPPSSRLGIQKGLVFAHINICSLRNKYLEIDRIIRDNSINIFAISETHLDDSFDDSCISINGFNVFRKDRNKFGGGVAIYIQNSLPGKMRTDLMINNIEACVVQVYLPFIKPIIVCCFYRPPSADAMYMESICEMLDRISDENCEIYALGDANVHWGLESCPNKKKLVSILNACNLSQVVECPTRITMGRDGSITSTCIDHIYTNASLRCSKAISSPVGCSDHNLIAITRFTKTPKPKANIISTRSYRSFNEASFLSEIEGVDWSIVSQELNPEIAVNKFMNLFMNIVNRHAPVKKFTVKNRPAPWLDSNLRALMKERDSAKKACAKSSSIEDNLKYRQLRNMVTKQNKIKRKDYYKQRLYESRLDSKKLWSALNEIMGRKSNVCHPLIESNGLVLTKPGDIANHFNNYYVGKVERLRQSMGTSQNTMSNDCIRNVIMKDKNCVFAFKPVEVDEVERLLCALPNSKLAGLDRLDSKLLRMTASTVAPPICHIFNRCLTTGIFPSIWKEAKVVPLPKDTKSVFNETNSRPISILPVLSKIMEKLVHSQVQEYFVKNKLFTDSQHAYRAGHSTSTALIQLTDEWLKSIDNSKVVGTVYLDYSAAFDVLDHILLVEKLKYYGLNQSVLKWFVSYLSLRSQRVYVNGALSSNYSLKCGVPQGSCLGPLLFSIFTNDLAWATRSANTVMYADDSTLYYSAASYGLLNEVLNSELSIVHNWVVCNKFVLNTSKTKCMMLGSRQKLASFPKLALNIGNSSIQQVESVKLLGVMVDCSLTWSSHISSIILKMGRAIGAVRRCCSIVSLPLLRQIVQSLVLCHLDYCSPVWSSANYGDLRKLQVVQNRAARLVLGCPMRTNITLMHDSLSWLTVLKRLSFNSLMLFKSVMSRSTPVYIHSQIFFSNTAHGHNTRLASDGHLVIPRPRTNFLKKAYSYRVISSWNSLPRELHFTDSRLAFKKYLKLFLSR